MSLSRARANIAGRRYPAASSVSIVSGDAAACRCVSTSPLKSLPPIEMAYRAAADAILVAHLAFVLFVVFGAFLVLRWPRFAWLHLPAVVWAAFIEFSGTICPLTPLEVALSQRAGRAGYVGGFIDHYI